MIDSISEWRNEIGRFQDMTCTTHQCPRASIRSVYTCSNCVAVIKGIGESKINKLLNLVKDAS